MNHILVSFFVSVGASVVIMGTVPVITPEVLLALKFLQVITGTVPVITPHPPQILSSSVEPV